jgi:hypothetical protein
VAPGLAGEVARAKDMETDDMARFLRACPTTHVLDTGHKITILV